MSAYRCSTCGLGYLYASKCEVCGGALWWSTSTNLSSEEEKQQAMKEKAQSSEWADPVDRRTNWRFESLVAAGYDLAAAEELANRYEVDLHEAAQRAAEHGARAAYLRFY